MSRKVTSSTKNNKSDADSEIDEEVDQEASESNRAGGLTALSGFFFQFVGTLAHIGEFSLRNPSSDVPQKAGETLFSVEVGDSDYQRTNGREVHIVQFKHSSDPENNKIYVEEFYEITKTLVLAKQSIMRADASARVHCVLATNRPLGNQAQEAMDVAKQGKINAELKERWGFKGYAKEVEYRFESEESWFEAVEKWGKNLGMTSHEVEKGIHDVAAIFVKKTLEGRRTFGIDAVHLTFVGFSSPRNVEQMHERSKEEIQSFFTRLEVPDAVEGRAIAHRSGLMGQIQTAIGSHALIVLAGQGGNGKSTLLAAALRDQLNNCFVVGSKISAIKDDWIPRSVSNWRNAPSSFDATQTLECAVERLGNRSDQRPILIAALDALDEVELDKPQVERLIRHFEQLERGPKPPPATLLLTCRDKAELDRLFGEPGHDHLQSASKLNVGKHIPVKIFDETEILSALSNTDSMSSIVRSRLRSEFGGTGALNVQTLRPQTSAPIDPDLREALYHPVIWGHLFDGNFEPSEQEALFNGDPQPLGKLAEQVLDWFGGRCEIRTENKVLRDLTKRITFDVAVHCQGRSSLIYPEDWEEPLKNQSHLLAHVTSVVKQAISAGLIEADFNPYSFAWRWRHPFLMQHLVNKYKPKEAP